MIPKVPGKTIVYKYRPLGDDTSRDRVRDILVNHRLYASSPLALNDPFECKAKWSLKASKKQRLRKTMQIAESRNPYAPQNAKKREARELQAAVADTGVENAKRVLSENAGFVSFGGSVDNLLMWAHYASDHRGIAIAFQAKHWGHADFFGEIHEVRYQSEFPVVEPYNFDAESVRNLMTTKSREWEYEAEHRFIIDTRDESPFVPFSSDLIAAIYMGCRIGNEDIRFIKDCVKDGCPSCQVFRAHMQDDAYGLRFERFEVR
ncbi:MAG: DUF2971 domain-containing protein [Planctomycetota bacterium]